MEYVKLLLYVFGVIIIIKIITNIFRLIEVSYFYHRYSKFLKKIEKNILDVKINQYCSFVGRLFNIAGTQQEVTVISKKYHQIHSRADLISNQLDNAFFTQELVSCFEKTKGVFISRIVESVNPFYWLSLPTNILDKCNCKISNPIARKALDFAFWIITGIASYALKYWLDNIEFFQELLKKLFENNK